jgi:hypothetical protein
MTNKKTKSQEKTLPEEGNDCAESTSPEAVERPAKSVVELAQKKIENGTAKERKALEVAKTCNTSSNLKEVFINDKTTSYGDLTTVVPYRRGIARACCERVCLVELYFV